MKAKLTFVCFFAVATLLAIPTHSQDLLKRIKPWLYPDDSFDALGAKREHLFGDNNFGNKKTSPFSNFSSQLGEMQISSDSVQAQWVKQYASGLIPVFDAATAIAVDESGNVYVAGHSRGLDTFDDYVTVKYNTSGVKQWVARYNGSGNSDDEATALVVDAAGNVYVTGYSVGSGTYNDYATVKYNAAGVEQWVVRYNGPGNGDDRATAFEVDVAGNIYVAGYSFDSNTGYDYATIKYNISGVEQWVARYNGPGNSSDVATALVVDAAENIFVTGYSRGSATSEDYAVVKYNATGVEQWVARYNGPGNSSDIATALAVDAAGNVYVIGSSVGSSTYADYATVKYNASGVEQWVTRYNGPGNFGGQATALAVDAAGNVYVTGYDDGSSTSTDYATVKYSASGVEQWVARYNGPGNSVDRAAALALDTSENVYVTGYSSGSGTLEDYATIKYNASGVEQWVTRYNGPGNYLDQANTLAIDTAGNVYVTGYSRGSGTLEDYSTIKYNASGVEQWEARYSGPGYSDDRATALAVDAAGNVYVTGYSKGSETSFDYATVKYNASGVEQWMARYNGPGNYNDQATALAVDAAGNVYVTGYSEDSETFYDYATVKYNASGVQQWVARYNGPGYSFDQATALAVDVAGDVYVTGYSRSSDGFYDYATAKYNSSGVQQWVIRYNGPRNIDDRAIALAVDNAGNVYVTGSSEGSDTSYDYDYVTIKYNASGVQQWVARYNGPGNSDDQATALAVDAVGNVYVTGYSVGSGPPFDYATIKYNTSGVEQWVARYDGQGLFAYDQATALAVDAAENVYVTGYSRSSGRSEDYATVKYNASGVEQWVARYNGPGNLNDQAIALAVDAAGNVYVTGFSQISDRFGDYDYATVKYNASGAQQWVARYNGPQNALDQAIALVVDAAKNVYVTGSSSQSIGQSIYTTIKYFQARTVTTNAATSVGATFATLNAMVNPNGLNTTVKFQYGTTAHYGSVVVASPNPVIGTTPISVSAKVMGLIPDTTYHFRIVAINAEETFFGEDQIFNTLPCGSLSIAHSQVSFHDAGSSITVAAQISGDCGVDSVVLKYRRGGDKNFSTAIVSVDSLYRWTIPASAVTSRGVEYFIAATDTFNAVPTRAPRVGVFSVQIKESSGAIKDRVQDSGSEQNAYRLISMPLDLDDKNAKAVLEDNLGPYNKKKWRLFSLRSDSQAYVEYSDTLKMDSGKAFMLIVKNPGKFLDIGAGKSNRTDKLFAIVLQPEWNFFGNPFNFPIPLKNISLTSERVFALRYHEGTWRDPILRKKTIIEPFEGYAIFNTSEVADTLLINPDLSPSPSPLAKEFASTIEEKMEWSIRIIAQCQEAVDEDNRAAIVSGASSSWDDLDQPEPPVIGEYVSVYFPHPEWDKLAKSYCTDFRPESSEGYVWPFEVKTNIRDKVNLTFEGIDKVPPELEVWLVDDALKITQNLREQGQYAVAGAGPVAVAVAVTGAEHVKQLKLMVGKHDFVDEKLAEARAIPTTYELSQNFPNPFNPATTIRYGLPSAERVTLKIYNLLGAEVATLVDNEQKPAGYHAAVWDGRDKAGRVVASGVYVYRMLAGSFVMTKKLGFIK